MNVVIELKVLDNFHIWIRFKGGSEKTVDFKPFIGKGISKDLLIEENFRRISLESGGGIAWYNGFDVCPNFLKQV